MYQLWISVSFYWRSKIGQFNTQKYGSQIKSNDNISFDIDLLKLINLAKPVESFEFRSFFSYKHTHTRALIKSEIEEKTIKIYVKCRTKVGTDSMPSCIEIHVYFGVASADAQRSLTYTSTQSHAHRYKYMFDNRPAHCTFVVFILFPCIEATIRVRDTSFCDFSATKNKQHKKTGFTKIVYCVFFHERIIYAKATNQPHQIECVRVWIVSSYVEIHKESEKERNQREYDYNHISVE